MSNAPVWVEVASKTIHYVLYGLLAGDVGVGLGKDHTIFAVVEGAVEFATKRKGRVYVSVRAQEVAR